MKANRNSGQFKKGKIVIYKDIACKICGNKFSVPPSGYGRTYCSRKCAGKSEERNIKISLGNKGKPKSEEHNKKVSDAIKKHYDKKGRKVQKRSHHTHIREDRKWRKDVFERDDYTCQECGKKGGYLQAHHIKGWTEYPDLRRDLNNGVTLCIDCHKKTDNYGAKGQNFKRGCIHLLRRAKNGKSQKKD